VNKKKTSKGNGKINRKESAKEETRNTIANMSGINDGGENDSHENISEEGRL